MPRDLLQDVEAALIAERKVTRRLRKQRNVLITALENIGKLGGLEPRGSRAQEIAQRALERARTVKP